ncbi:MAG TPA: helix-turn-helix domain-containing protein [Bacillota bacterium]
MGGSRERASDDRHQRILEVATALLRKGAPVGMREIARAAGVAVGTLYLHYSNKEQLLEAVRAQAAGELTRRLQRERLNPGRPLAARLLAVAEGLEAIAPLYGDPKPLRALAEPALAWMLEDATRRGEIPPAADDEARFRVRLLATVLAAAALVPWGDGIEGVGADGGSQAAQPGRRWSALLADILAAGLAAVRPGDRRRPDPDGG